MHSGIRLKLKGKIAANLNCFGKVAPIVKCLHGDKLKIRECLHIGITRGNG